MARIPVWLVALLVLLASLALVPFVPWMCLALWLGLYLRRVHGPLTRRLGGRTKLSATLTVSLLLVIALPIAAVVTSIVLDAIALVQQLMQSDETRTTLAQLVQGGGQKPTEAATSFDASSALDLLRSQGGRAWAIAQQVAGAAARIVIGLLIMVTGMYGVLTSGSEWWRWCEAHAGFAPAHLRRFGEAFVETGRGLWFGIVGAGLMQSIVATITYLVIGVPSALALGMLTLLFSVIPAIGTALVWVPVAAGLAITGRTGAAIALGVVGVAVIGSVDNLARPLLARRGKLQLPSWLVLVGMFGGIELIGGWGLLLGPLALRLGKEALILRRETATSSQPVASTDPS